MKTYRGYRLMQSSPRCEANTCCCTVTVEDGEQQYELDPRYDLWKHSPTGFEWGYRGSGPAQLALALVADCCGQSIAMAVYQRVKELVVAGLPHDGWTLTDLHILAAVNRAHTEMGQVQP